MRNSKTNKVSFCSLPPSAYQSSVISPSLNAKPGQGHVKLPRINEVGQGSISAAHKPFKRNLMESVYGKSKFDRLGKLLKFTCCISTGAILPYSITEFLTHTRSNSALDLAAAPCQLTQNIAELPLGRRYQNASFPRSSGYHRNFSLRTTHH